MSKIEKEKQGKERTISLFSRLRSHAWFLAVLWTGCVAASLLWNLNEQSRNTLKIARNSAEITFENDVLYRRWAAQHGGVYVPVSQNTPPNPYLNVPNRDVNTTSGLSLTLINPAYMVRQVNQMDGYIHGGRGHLTSLKPIRPENRPDLWETAALKAFENGTKEVASVEKKKDGEYLCLMRPFITGKSCLKCHEAQGYKEGDVRGGISVAVPLAPLLAIEKSHIVVMSLAHFGLWMVGLTGIAISKNRLASQILTRERAEDALRQSEERYHNLFDSMTEGFALHEIILDEKGVPCDYKFIEINPAFEQLTGLKRKDVVGKLVSEVLPNNDSHLVEIYGKVALAGEPVHFDSFSTPLKKYYEIYAYRPAPLQFAVLFTDVSERRKKEEQLNQITEELKRSNVELQQFAYVASHDLREPLRAISGFIGLLDMNYKDKLDEKGSEYISYATKGVMRMDELLSGLLEYARVNTRGETPKLVSAQQALDAAIANLHRSITETNSLITIDKLPTVRVDCRQLTQLFQNLIHNAIKFRENQSPQIYIGSRKQKDGHLFWVKDNGIGIEEQSYERIFKIFQRLHSQNKYPGYGMGLAICKRIIERHGGQMWVESQIGKGSTFYFTL